MIRQGLGEWLREWLRRYVGPRPYFIFIGDGSDLDKWLIQEETCGTFKDAPLPRWAILLSYFESVPITKRDWWMRPFARHLRHLGKEYKRHDGY